MAAKTSSATLKDEDGSTVESIIEALYESMSFLPDEEPNWLRFRKLFLPEAMIILIEGDGDEEQLIAMDIASFTKSAKKNIEASGMKEKGLLEIEVSRRLESFGAIAQVWSTYEDRFSVDDVNPEVRGINSIQLVHTKGRWWITSMMWNHETEEKPIPSRYQNN